MEFFQQICSHFGQDKVAVGCMVALLESLGSLSPVCHV